MDADETIPAADAVEEVVAPEAEVETPAVEEEETPAEIDTPAV